MVLILYQKIVNQIKMNSKARETTLLKYIKEKFDDKTT